MKKGLFVLQGEVVGADRRLPANRQRRIAELTDQVARGLYHVPAYQLADKLLHAMLHGGPAVG